MIYLLFLISLALPSYLVRFKIFGVPTNVLEIIIYLSFFIQIIILRKEIPKSLSIRNLKHLLKQSRLTPIILLFVAVFLSILVAADKRMALGIFKGWFLDPFLVFLMVQKNIKNQKDLLKIGLGLSLGVILISVWAVTQSLGFWYLLPHQEVEDFYGYILEKRAFGPFESPNYLGMYLAPASIFLLGLGLFCLKEKAEKSQEYLKIYRYFLLSSFIFSLVALLLSKSSGALLAFLAGLFFLLYHYLEKKAFFAKIIIFLILLAVGFFLVTLNFAKTQTSFSIRKEIWQAAFSFIKSKPLLGVGLGGFPKVFDKYLWQHYPLLPSWAPWARMHPHNLFLAFWLNLGFLGFLSFLWLLYCFFKELDFRAPLSFILAGAMLSIILHGLLDTTYWKNDLSVLFWLILSLAFKKLEES